MTPVNRVTPLRGIHPLVVRCLIREVNSDNILLALDKSYLNSGHVVDGETLTGINGIVGSLFS